MISPSINEEGLKTLGKDWNANLSVQKKLSLLTRHLVSLPQLADIEEALSVEEFPPLRLAVNESRLDYASEAREECSF